MLKGSLAGNDDVVTVTIELEELIAEKLDAEGAVDDRVGTNQAGEEEDEDEESREHAEDDEFGGMSTRTGLLRIRCVKCEKLLNPANNKHEYLALKEIESRSACGVCLVLATEILAPA